MAYLYESDALHGEPQRALVPAPSPIAALIKAALPLIALVAIGLILWYVLKGRKNPRRRRARASNPTKTLGRWDPKQADETRRRELRRLVAEDGYAKVVRRLTLTKNTGAAPKSVVNADLDYLADAEGRS